VFFFRLENREPPIVSYQTVSIRRRVSHQYYNIIIIGTFVSIVNIDIYCESVTHA